MAGVLLAAGPTARAQTIEREGQPLVFTVPDEDAAMAAAIAEARRTVSGLIAQLDTLRTSGAHYSVKMPLPTAKGAEHIWLGDIVYRDGIFHGVLDNVPVSLPSMALGDPVSVRPDQVSDWFVIRDGELYGGYTIYVYRSRLNEAERRDFDAGMGFYIPPVPRPL